MIDKKIVILGDFLQTLPDIRFSEPIFIKIGENYYIPVKAESENSALVITCEAEEQESDGEWGRKKA